jgi:pimeloyl-ACP methyl ester carboxylesterase
MLADGTARSVVNTYKVGGASSRRPDGPETGKEQSMATFVLVHGGGHGGWCYRKVAPLLRAAGHEVHAPSLTGLGERAHLLGPDIDLNTHIQVVAALLHYEDLTDVILVGHSYGGMVITGAADRAGRSRSTTSSARPRSPPGTRTSSPRPVPPGGCGTSIPAMT